MLLILILFVFMLGLMAGGVLASRAAEERAHHGVNSTHHENHPPKLPPHGPHLAAQPPPEKNPNVSVPLPGMSAARELEIDLPEDEAEPSEKVVVETKKVVKPKDLNEINKETIMAVLQGKTENLPSQAIEELMHVPDDVVNQYMAELEAEGKIFKNERRDFSTHLHT